MTALRSLLAALAVALVATSATLAAPAPSVPGSSREARAARAAVGEIGVPYRWGGASPSSGFDSSGLVVWAYAQVGLRGLPHFAGDLWTRGRRVPRAHLRPGDIVFFHGTSHVGIYLGGGRFVHAPRTGSSVQVSSLRGAYGAGAYSGAVRLT
jgi:cell wall-associated NlpC family hydrolase